MIFDKMTAREKLLSQVACCNWLLSMRWEWKDAVNTALEWWGQK